MGSEVQYPCELLFGNVALTAQFHCFQDCVGVIVNQECHDVHILNDFAT